ncbi:MAG TPA: RNA-binding S4 domain-containing protein [Rhodocyclaceae bacterium]|nr:RNA-binding S4 domain-containing protein [Rhodocyclaceae bacterium]
MSQHKFQLTSEYIELDKLLKLLSIASSGGAAKVMVAQGMVTVDGKPETRKTRKLRAGSVVRIGDEEIHVLGRRGA